MRACHNRSTSARRGGVAAVEIDRADQRLADIGEDRRPGAAAGIGFGRTEPDRRAEIDGARDLRAGFLAHQIGEPARQLALVGPRVGAKQHVGNHQAEHVIAEKLHALIGVGAVARALERGNVREPAIEQRGVVEFVADPLLERTVAAAAAAAGSFLPVGRLRPRPAPARRSASAVAAAPALADGFGFALAAHRTRVNSRFQRTVHGQRQTSQACAPSRIEKKMICALPMMFSYGT